jgi:copper transport protein
MPLAILLRQSKRGALSALLRFSRIAVPVVGVLVLAGLALAIIELRSPRALIDTQYGIILSIKLVLVVVLLGLATLNRYRLVPALAVEPGASRSLGRAILLECAVAVATIAVVAGWRFTPPPRSLPPDTPLVVHIHSEKAIFQVLIALSRVGTDDFVLQLMNGDGGPLLAKEATLTLSLPARGVEPLERSAVLGPASGPLAHADRCPGDRFRRGEPGRRF